MKLADLVVAGMPDLMKEYGHKITAHQRQALHAIALCDAGKPEQGRAEAKLFLRRHGESALARTVREACPGPSTAAHRNLPGRTTHGGTEETP